MFLFISLRTKFAGDRNVVCPHLMVLWSFKVLLPEEVTTFCISHRLPGDVAAGLSHTLSNEVVGDDMGPPINYVTDELNKAVR